MYYDESSTECKTLGVSQKYHHKLYIHHGLLTEYNYYSPAYISGYPLHACGYLRALISASSYSLAHAQVARIQYWYRVV